MTRKWLRECVESACHSVVKSCTQLFPSWLPRHPPPIQTPPQRSRDTFQHKGSHKYHPLPLVTVVDAVWRPAFLVFWVEPQPRWRHAIKLIGVWEGEGGSWQINRLTCITLVVGPMKIIIELQWRNFTRNSATIFVVFVSQIMQKKCLGSMVIGR